MDWAQVGIIIGFNLGLTLGMFLWLRAEASADRREITNHMNTLTAEIRAEIKEIRAEMKDFHARLCVIEEKRVSR